MITHSVLILFHATGGIVAFITGFILLIPSLSQRSRYTWLTLFLGGLAVLILCLFAVITLEWAHFPLSKRIIFSVLGLLALYMAWRGFQAYRVFRDRPGGWMAPFADHVGFVLISLFDGLVIISSQDLGAPGWVVGVIAVLGVLVGIWDIIRVKRGELKRMTG